MKLLKLTFLLLLLAMTGRAATVTFSVTNNVGPDTNSILIQPISSYINADGSVQSTGLPFRIFPTNGFASTVLQPGNYLATNSFICSQYVGPGNFGTSQGVIFAVPNSSGTFSFGQLAISGYNVFNYNGASFVVTASNIFAAMGYTPLTPQQVTNLFLLSNTNIYQASTNIVFVISNGVTLVTAPPQGFLTNGLAGPGITNGLATTNYANGITNGQTSIVYSNPASFTTPLQATNIAYNQATNQGAASTNMTLSASNALAFIFTASLQGTNGALTATIIASNATQAASLLASTNALWAGKQPSNGILTALAGTGAWTNNLVAGTNVVFATNLSTYVVTIQVPTQGWLTNLLGSAAYASISAFLPASILPGLTNGFLPLNGTNGLLGTNVAYSTFYLQSNPSNYVSAVVTNGLASIQFVLSSMAASNGSFATLSQVQSSNNAAIQAAATLATNFGYQIGAGATNFANGVGQGATNLAYIIGFNGTNNSQVLSNNILNASAVVSTNYANIVGAATTNNLNSASNALALTLGGLQLRAITNFNTSPVTLTNPANIIVGILSGTAAGVSNLPASSITNAGILIYSNTVTSNNIAGKINIGQIFGAATTNSFLTITNGFAQNQFGFGTRTNFTVTTNVVGIIGGSSTEGTYLGIPFNMTWTNYWNTNFTILASAGNYFLMSNSTSLYSSPDMINWSLVSGVLPVPIGFFGTKWHMTGSLLDGWLSSTNLTAQLNAAISAYALTGQVSSASIGVTNLNILGTGPHAGRIAFPDGDTIIELSQANVQRASDSGISIGITNGQILGEQFSFVAGAFNDVAGEWPSGPYVYGAAIPGGFGNIIGDGGGLGNWGDGSYSFIAGGATNTVFGNGSFAAGRYVVSLLPGEFTFNDGNYPNTTNVAPSMVLLLATNGVAINTTNAGYALNVGGPVNATALLINGTPIGNISSNALANLNGTATNATLIGSNTISGFTFYQNISSRTNALIVSGAPTTNLTYPNLNGEWDWNGTIQVFTNTFPGAGGQRLSILGQGRMIDSVAGQALFTSFSNAIIGLYQGSFPQQIFGPLAFLTVSWKNPTWVNTTNLVSPTNTPIGYGTNSFMLVNSTGPNGGAIVFPGGDQIYEQSESDVNVTSDSGLSLGLNNGEIFGEKYSTVLGAYNDVAGFYTSSIRGASVLGGTNNIIGSIAALPFLGGDGSWSVIDGGVSNQIGAAYSFALGSYNTVTNNNSGIISDGSAAQTTTTSNQLVMIFKRGIAMGTNTAGTNQLAVNGPVNVNGDLTATNLFGNGAGVTGVKIGWNGITNAPGTNFVATSWGGVNAYLLEEPGSLLSGISPAFTYADPISKSNLVVIGGDTANAQGGNSIRGANGIAGLLQCYGWPPTNAGGYYNLGGLTVVNGYSGCGTADFRKWIQRVKDPSVEPGLIDAGTYCLFENRYLPGAPDQDTSYANYQLIDNTGNMGLGDLGERSDDRSNGNLYPTAKVTVYGSPNNNYPAFQVVHDYANTNQIMFQVAANGVATANGAGITNLNLANVSSPYYFRCNPQSDDSPSGDSSWFTVMPAALDANQFFFAADAFSGGNQNLGRYSIPPNYIQGTGTNWIVSLRVGSTNAATWSGSIFYYVMTNGCQLQRDHWTVTFTTPATNVFTDFFFTNSIHANWTNSSWDGIQFFGFSPGTANTNVWLFSCTVKIF